MYVGLYIHVSMLVRGFLFRRFVAIATNDLDMRTHGDFITCDSVALLLLSNLQLYHFLIFFFFNNQNRSRAQLLMEMVAGLTEFSVATKQGRATRKISKRSNWLPIGASR